MEMSCPPQQTGRTGQLWTGRHNTKHLSKIRHKCTRSRV